MLFELPRSVEELEKMRGKLAGKMILLSGPASALKLPEASIVHRFNNEELAELATELIPVKDPFRLAFDPPLPDKLEARIEDWL